MRIVNIKTYALVSQMDKPFFYGEGWIRQRSSLIVEVLTDEGIIGWGEGFCHGNQSPLLAQAVVENVLKPILIGKDPSDTDVLWDTMYYETQTYGRKGIVISAISAIDVALWDCLGKKEGKPIYKLLGGAYRRDVPAYASGFFRKPYEKYPDKNIDEALCYVDQGFKAMKMKGGFGVKEDIITMEKVRDAVGFDVSIMIDANCAYNASYARKILYAYDKLDVFWFEEPLPPHDYEGYLELKNSTSVLIAGGENEFTKYGFQKWIASKALDILQPDLCFAGGFTECKKIIALAQAWNTILMPHAWGSAIAQAASMQFLAIIPPMPLTFTPIEPIFEYDQSDHPFRKDLVSPVLELNSDGRVAISDKPGIGVDINREILKKYSV
jgi:D-galactarolactone cycloisomerase